MMASIGPRAPIYYGSLSQLEAEPRSRIALSLRIPKGLVLLPEDREDHQDPLNMAEALMLRYGGETLQILELAEALVLRITPLSEDTVELLQTALDLVWSEHTTEEAQRLTHALNARLVQLPLSIDHLGAVHIRRDPR